MKTIMLSLTKMALLLCAITITNAQTTYTVDNTPNSGAQFTNIQSAIDAASNGDTIYVQQSTTPYGSVIINKNITLIGRSHVQSTFYDTVLNSITLDDGSNNSIIKGIRAGFLGGEIGYTSVIANITIQDCSISGIDLTGGNSALPGSFSNVSIIGNTIQRITVRNLGSDITISNNLLGGLTIDADTNTLITNNIFDYGGGQFLENSDSDPLNITNCIISSAGNVVGNSGSYSFNNCHFYQNSSNTGLITLQDNGAQTQNTNNCTFMGEPLFITPFTNRLDPNLNLALQTNSPLIGAGANGGNIGFQQNFIFKYLGNPKGVPEVKVTNYTGATTPNGTVTFNIEAKSH